MSWKLLIGGMACALIVGCSTDWYNPYLTSEQASIQFDIDQGYCQGVSHGTVPMPTVRPYPASPSSYTIQTYGQISGQGSRSSFTSSSYVTPLSTANFATGFAQGAQIGNALAAYEARANFYRSCMMSLGWFDDQKKAQQLADSARRAARKPLPSTGQFWADLEAAVPAFREINDDPRFHHWLAVTDSTTGKQRQQLLADAQARSDADTVAAMFKQFLTVQ